MVVTPNNHEEWLQLMQFLNHGAFVQPTPDMKLFGWVADGQIAMVVGVNGILGKVCQMHVAMRPEFTYTPKEMLATVFRYTFETENLEYVLGIVNSKNEKAMKYDQHLGFKEMWRLPKMHDDEGDLVVLGMKRDECKYYQRVLQ